MPRAGLSRMKFKTIAIVGLGLMGGSLAACCRKKFPKSRIVGISRNPQAVSGALKKKWIHQGTSRIDQGIRDADFIILCTPVDTLPSLLKLCDRFAKPGTLVTDVGSVKEGICTFFKKEKWKNISFVGAHPMVGSHERGIHAARPDLYNQGIVFLNRTQKVKESDFQTFRTFWKKTGAYVAEINPELHDRIVAEISHLPHLAAVSLILTAQQKNFSFAGSGFRDTTRIAQGDPSIWVPILLANRKNISEALKRFEKQLSALRRVIESNKRKPLERILRQAMVRRKEI